MERALQQCILAKFVVFKLKRKFSIYNYIIYVSRKMLMIIIIINKKYVFVIVPEKEMNRRGKQYKLEVRVLHNIFN